MATKVIFSDGDKGGTGKSVVSLVIADWLYERVDPARVLLIEADGLIPDVWPHFKDTGMSSMLVEMASDPAAAVGRIADSVSDGEHDYIVVNMPANASIAMQEFVGCMGDVFRDEGCDLRVAWSLGNTNGCLQSLEDAQKKGAMAMCSTANKILLLPEMFGAREAFGDISFFEGEVAVMPKLSPANVAQPAFKAPMPLHPLCQKEIGAANGVNTLARAILNRWIKASREALKPLFPELDV